VDFHGRITGGIVGAAALWLVAMAAAAGAATRPSFTPVQPGLFDAPKAIVTAWSDYDLDGDADLLVTFGTGEVRLYRNEGGSFANVAPALGLPARGEEVRAAAWGDYDGDGDPDLYLGTRSRKFLYRNDGGRFVEIGRSVGLDVADASARQATWIDYDNDGDLDLFAAIRSGANMLFRNDGGEFHDVAAQIGLADTRPSVGACWFDMDRDGDLDVFVSNQDGATDAFFRDDAGIFRDVAPELGMDRSGRGPAEGSVGCTAGDYDNDGNIDLFVAAYGTSLLYHNEGGGRFSEVAAARGVAIDGHMVGAAWADYDNDGRLDLFVTGYKGKGDTAIADDRLFRNLGDRFVNLLTPGQPLNGADHGVQWGDFDRDGDLDIALAQFYPATGRHPVLRNDLPDPARRRSLAVVVVDARGHRTRAGSEVRILDRAGRTLATRLVSTGEGYDAQSDMPVHFGLARRGRVTVEVTFLAAKRRSVVRVTTDPRRFQGRALVVRQPNRETGKE
jgi:hypothetical protein